MERVDLYEVLGVKRTATTTEIRRAYRKLARKFHPDINPGDRLAEVRYQRISEAFEVLSDCDERERYDRQGLSRPVEAPPTYGFEGFDFTSAAPSDAHVFQEIFAPSAPERAATGENLLHHLTMSFDESLRGLETTFRVRRLVACADCAGWGQVASGSPSPCEPCRGTGRLTQSRGHMIFAKPCPACGGAGAVHLARCRRSCAACKGAGRTAREEVVRVRIPAGVEDGAKLRVAGKGNDGRGGSGTGDLFVRLQVTPHPFLVREGDHLFCTVPITFTEAALGCKLELPTPESVAIRFPGGTQSGQILRVPGRGASSPRPRAGRGDLHLTIQVVTPRVYDEKARALLRELERLHPENPREERLRSLGGSPPAAMGETS